VDEGSDLVEGVLETVKRSRNHSLVVFFFSDADARRRRRFCRV
jgi:hypothetical protein